MEIQQNQLEQFEKQIEPHLANILKYCVGVLKNPHLGEEAAQNTMLTAWRTMAEKYKPDKGTPLQWMIGIARNKCYRLLKEEKNQRKSKESGAGSERLKAQSPDKQAANAELVRLALHSLPDNERELIILRCQNGFSHREIAEIVGGQENSVRGRISEIKGKLKKYLKEGGA